MKLQTKAVNRKSLRYQFFFQRHSSAMAGPSVLSTHPSLKVVEVSIVDARFTGSVLPPWIAEVELILKYSDETLLQRRTAREAKAILGVWFTLKISEYLSI